MAVSISLKSQKWNCFWCRFSSKFNLIVSELMIQALFNELLFLQHFRYFRKILWFFADFSDSLGLLKLSLQCLALIHQACFHECLLYCDLQIVSAPCFDHLTKDGHLGLKINGDIRFFFSFHNKPSPKSLMNPKLNLSGDYFPRSCLSVCVLAGG